MEVFMEPVISHYETKTIKLEKFSTEKKHPLTKIASSILKELKRPMGEYLGKKFSKVHETEQEIQTKTQLEKAGKGRELKLEIGDKGQVIGAF